MTSVLDTVLGDYAKQGFKLKEETDTYIELYYEGRPIVIFTQNVSVEEIRKACQEYIELKEAQHETI